MLYAEIRCILKGPMDQDPDNRDQSLGQKLRWLMVLLSSIFRCEAMLRKIGFLHRFFHCQGWGSWGAIARFGRFGRRDG
jgi:hypothetical protein